jgi:flagellar biosynthetic protein FliS
MIPPDYVRRHARAHSTSLDRARLELLVLEGGHAFLTRARDALERGDVAAFVADLARTQDVVLEIAQTTEARGSSVAAGLAALHELMVRRLARANAARGLDLVDELLCAYGPIVEAYRRIVRGEP